MKAWRWAALALAAAVLLFPVYWMLVTSFKPAAEVFRSPPGFVPEHWSLDAYRAIFAGRPMLRYAANSLVVACGTTLLSMALASMAAYGFTRFPMRGAGALLLALLFVKLLPETLLVVPAYRIAAELGLLDTYLVLILAYASFALPFALWMLIGFFRAIPREIDEAAIVDGATRLQAFRLVILPLARPGLLAVGFFTFLSAWNAYLWALVLTTRPQMFVLPVGIANMVGEYQVQWNELMAAAVIATIPAAALFALFSDNLAHAVTAGAVKG